MDKAGGLDDAVDMVADGACIYTGGAILHRKPMAFVRAVVAGRRRDLHLVSFAGSVDADLLVGAGCVTRLTTAYVGLGAYGRAPHVTAAVTNGRVVDDEHTEWMLLGQLRAAAMGIPFLPTRAGTGSQIAAGLGFRQIEDPYGGDTFIAVPPLQPDVTVLHAWRATREGDVQFCWPPEHLWDVDVLAARAARRVIVTVDEVVGRDVVMEQPQLTRLFGFDVDVIVHAPDGAWPTASPPLHPEPDASAITEYVSSGGVMSSLNPTHVASS